MMQINLCLCNCVWWWDQSCAQWMQPTVYTNDIYWVEKKRLTVSYISASEWNLSLLKSDLVVDDFFFFKKGGFFCLSHQNFGGGMRPPHNTMGPGMPGVNMWAFLNGRNYQSWALRLINTFSNNNLNDLVGTQGSGNWSAMAQSQ